MSIIIGHSAINRWDFWGNGVTIVIKDNPAAASGKITSVEIYSYQTISNCIVAIFSASGNSLTVRNSVNVGTVTSGAKRTFTVNLLVETGDHIGIYLPSGNLEFQPDGTGNGLWWLDGNYTSASGVTFNSTSSKWMISLRGIGVIMASATVTTDVIPSVKDHESATIGGEVTDAGNAKITERGFEYKEGVAGEVKTVSEIDADFGTGAFSLEITGLKPYIEYYYRSYAVNEMGTGYGDWESFTTDKYTPEGTYDGAADVAATSLTLKGTIIGDGGTEVTTRGFDIGLTKDIYDTESDSGSYGKGAFTKAVSGLDSNTTYWVRIRLVNSEGTYLGEWEEVQTAALGVIPTNKRINIVSDYGGYVYNTGRVVLDDGDIYVSFFEFTTDLLNEQIGTMVYKRVLEIWLFINSQTVGNLNLKIKRDTENIWQEAGIFSMVQDGIISRVQLPCDYRARTFQFRLESTNYFDFLGLIAGYRKDGIR